jgi:transcriptional regulator with XRE-family HTH domain
MTIGQRIEEERIARGIPVARVAKAAGITYRGLHKVITGASSPTLDTLHRVSIALGVSVSYLVEGVAYDGAE